MVLDALGRRIEFVTDVLAGAPTTRYYYDGVNEVLETDGAGTPANLRSCVHGVSYVDERLMMKDFKDSGSSDDRPYYYAVDRMYNVVMLIDRAGAIVERYCYDAYGRPYIRESCGRGDMDDDTDMDTTDDAHFAAARGGSTWDPRADLDDDGDVDGDDQDLYDAKYGDWDWDPPGYGPSVSQAFSDVGNPYMFQGVPHFALDTATEATSGKLLLNHHRGRYADPIAGRWGTRDPLYYSAATLSTVPDGAFDARTGRFKIPGPVDEESMCLSCSVRFACRPFEPGSPDSVAASVFLMLLANPVQAFDPYGTTAQCSLSFSCSGCSGFPVVLAWSCPDCHQCFQFKRCDATNIILDCAHCKVVSYTTQCVYDSKKRCN